VSLANNPLINPPYYQTLPIQPVDVTEAWSLGFHLGSVVKYLARAGRKERSRLTDLKKALWYLDREVRRVEAEEAQSDSEDEGTAVCRACGGSGTSRASPRPDDHGPHFICPTCRGTGQASSSP
jgi:hypothetical protein